MPEVTQKDLDDLGTAIREMRKSVETQVDEVKAGLRTEEESRKEHIQRYVDIEKKVEELRRLMPEPGKLTERQGNAAASKGGIFDGDEPMLSWIELMAMPANSPVLRGPDADLVRNMQDANDSVALQLAMRTHRHQDVEKATRETLKTKDYARLRRACKHGGFGDDYFKDTLMHPSSGGAGAPLTTTILSSTLFEEVTLRLRVADKFPTIPLVNNKQDFPIQRGYPIGVRLGVATTDPPPRADMTGSPWPGATFFTSVSFGLVKFDVVDVGGYMWFNDHMLTDTVLPWMPFMNRQIAFAIARARDRACFEGDIQGRSAGAHMDDWGDTYLTNDARTLWNGLRRIGANYTLDNSAAVFDVDAFRAGKKKLGIFGFNVQDLYCWINISSHYNLIHDPDVVTVDKIGIDRATIRTGTQGFIDAIPFGASEWVREDLASTGVAANGGTLTCAVIADTSRFLLGTWGVVQLELTRVAPMLANIIQGHSREDFVPMEAIDGNKIFAAGASSSPVVIIRNVAK